MNGFRRNGPIPSRESERTGRSRFVRDRLLAVSTGAERKPYDSQQLAAGWQSMTMLASLVQRGGHPAAVRPTMPLVAREKQYASFPADVRLFHSAKVDLSHSIGGLFLGGGAGPEGWTDEGRRMVVVTSRRIVVRDVDHEFRSLISLQPNPLDFSVTLYFQGFAPLELSGPWVPWMTVVLCAEMFGSPWPPGRAPLPDLQVPAQRGQRPLTKIR